MSPDYKTFWDPTRPSRDVYDFTDLDNLVAFGEKHGMEVFAPALVYDFSLPDWLTEGDFTREELIEILHEHVTTFVKHYQGRVVWQVVGEPVRGRLNPYVGGFWAEKIGPEYIRMACKWAREADPNAKLFINDGGVEGMGPWSTEVYGQRSEFFYNLVKGLAEEGLIDGVGLQMHVGIKGCPPDPEWNFPRECPPLEEVAANIARFAELGLEVRITEMDVVIGHPPPYTEEELAERVKIYRDVLQICLNSPACTAVTTWGVTDKYSWIRSWRKEEWESPLLFDDEGNPKPAYWAVFDVLSRR